VLGQEEICPGSLGNEAAVRRKKKSRVLFVEGLRGESRDTGPGPCAKTGGLQGVGRNLATNSRSPLEETLRENDRLTSSETKKNQMRGIIPSPKKKTEGMLVALQKRFHWHKGTHGKRETS